MSSRDRHRSFRWIKYMYHRFFFGVCVSITRIKWQKWQKLSHLELRVESNPRLQATYETVLSAIPRTVLFRVNLRLGARVLCTVYIEN